METKQFVFTGLSWMTPKQIQATCSTLEELKSFGINYDFRRGTKGVRLIIKNFDDTVQDDYDESHVVFYKKIHSTADDLSEDIFVIFAIDDDMNVRYKRIDSRFLFDY